MDFTSTVNAFGCMTKPVYLMSFCGGYSEKEKDYMLIKVRNRTQILSCTALKYKRSTKQVE